MSQFAALEALLQEWRADGFDRDDVEVWAIARSGDATTIESFAAGSQSSCFTGGSDVYTDYGAAKDDLFVIDGQGRLRHRMDTGEESLRNDGPRDKLDGWVRGLLD